jgi:glycosyltransferase involved in cell wall biosynthesis
MRDALRRDVGGFDIVHLQSVFLFPTWAGARAAEAAGVPYLISPRGMLGEVVIRRKSRWVKTLWIRLIERQTLARAAAVHVTSELEALEIASLRLPMRRSVCIPNGVSAPARHAPLDRQRHPGTSGPYALFLSRIDWKKGLDRLIAAWRWVPDMTLVIAGNDETGYQRELQKLAGENGVANRIIFAGPVSDQNKWALYENASMLILPSYSENFGNVVAEAMSMGCPVIVTPEVGLAKLVAESGAGLVVDGAPRPLAKAVRALMQDAAGRRLMGERGKFTARRRLSWEAAAAQMEAIYADVRGR